LQCAAEERSGTLGLNVVFGGMHYAGIMITWGELASGVWAGILKLVLGALHKKTALRRGF